MKYANNVLELIGNTPLVRLNDISNSSGNLVLGKCEFLNPTSSVKDRVGLNMIETALKDGKINSNSTIIEPTSGNTGIGLASVCAVKGISLILTMPSSMSLERRQILKALGAKIILTEPSLGMNGAIEEAKKLNATIPNSYIPSQFDNPSNCDIHSKTTAREIIEDCTIDNKCKIDYFISAVGTGGTLSGTGEILKKECNTKIVAVEPDNSAVISGEPANPHKIQGIGAGFIPSVLDVDLIDLIEKISYEESIEFSRNIAKNEGLLVGISSGANMAIASKIAHQNKNKNLTIVTILCDSGERYLSGDLYE